MPPRAICAGCAAIASRSRRDRRSRTRSRNSRSDRLRELRRAAEAAVAGVVAARDLRRGARSSRATCQRLASTARRSGAARCARTSCARLRRSRSSRRVSPERRATGSQHARNDGMPWRVSGGKYVPPKNGTPSGVQEDGHRPAAVSGHRLHGGHVDGVEVRALLAVDLDVHEVLVHERGDVGVLEGLVLHHVTPVTRGVADREEHRLVLGLARFASASGPHGYQSTGLSLCCRRYGEVSLGEPVGHAVNPMRSARQNLRRRRRRWPDRAQHARRVDRPRRRSRIVGSKVLESRPSRSSAPSRREALHAPNGFLHAGSVITLPTRVAATGRDEPPGRRDGFATIELKANFLGTALEGDITCVARPVHRGRTTQVWDAEVPIGDQRQDDRVVPVHAVGAHAALIRSGQGTNAPFHIDSCIMSVAGNCFKGVRVDCPACGEAISAGSSRSTRRGSRSWSSDCPHRAICSGSQTRTTSTGTRPAGRRGRPGPSVQAVRDARSCRRSAHDPLLVRRVLRPGSGRRMGDRGRSRHRCDRRHRPPARRGRHRAARHPRPARTPRRRRGHRRRVAPARPRDPRAEAIRRGDCRGTTSSRAWTRPRGSPRASAPALQSCTSGTCRTATALDGRLDAVVLAADIFENHGVAPPSRRSVSGVGTTLRNIERVQEREPRVGVALDTEFVAMHDEVDDALTADWLWPNVLHVHVKDFADGARRRRRRPAVPPPGGRNGRFPEGLRRVRAARLSRRRLARSTRGPSRRRHRR